MRRTLLLGILLGIVISGVAGLIVVSTMPSNEKIQEITFEEFGIDPNVRTNPLIAGLFDTIFSPVQERVRDRVVDDVRTSVLLAGAGVVTITALGVALISADAGRRRAKDTSASS